MGHVDSERSLARSRGPGHRADLSPAEVAVVGLGDPPGEISAQCDPASKIREIDGELGNRRQARQADRPSRRSARACPWRRLHTVMKRWVCDDDPVVQFSQRPPGLDAELIDDHPPRLLVSRQCLRLPAGAYQRDHELLVKAFPERVHRRYPAQLRNRLHMPTEAEVGIDPPLQGLQPLLHKLRHIGQVQSQGIHLGEPRPAAEQLQCARQVTGRLSPAAAPPGRPSVIPQPREPLQVQFTVVYLGKVAGRHRLDPPADTTA
jgi:hypothetical protein